MWLRVCFRTAKYCHVATKTSFGIGPRRAGLAVWFTTRSRPRHRILLVYMTGIGERHIAKEILERNDFQLYTQKMVPNSGVINHLSGTANTLEVWQLSY